MMSNSMSWLTNNSINQDDFPVAYAQMKAAEENARKRRIEDIADAKYNAEIRKKIGVTLFVLFSLIIWFVDFHKLPFFLFTTPLGQLV